MALDTEARGDPREGGAVKRLFRGFGYLFAAMGFVFKEHPGLLKYCLLPLLINVLVFAGVATGLYFYYDELVALIWARPDSAFVRIFWYLLYVFILAVVALMAYFAFFILQGILAAPFNDLLSERVEQVAYGKDPPPFSWGGFASGIGRSIAQEVAKLAIFAAVMIPLFLLNLAIPVIGPVLYLLIGGYLMVRFVSYDYMDLSMARRQWGFRRKWRAVKQHRALTVGFGSAVALMLLVPLLGLFFVAFAAVGGTLLFCDLERGGAFETPSE